MAKAGYLSQPLSPPHLPKVRSPYVIFSVVLDYTDHEIEFAKEIN